MPARPGILSSELMNQLWPYKDPGLLSTKVISILGLLNILGLSFSFFFFETATWLYPLSGSPSLPVSLSLWSFTVLHAIITIPCCLYGSDCVNLGEIKVD